MRHVRFFDRAILRQKKKIIDVKRRFSFAFSPFCRGNGNDSQSFCLRRTQTPSFVFVIVWPRPNCDPAKASLRNPGQILLGYYSRLFNPRNFHLARRRRTGCETDEILSRSFLVFPVSRLDFHHLSRLISTDFFFKPRRNSR